MLAHQILGQIRWFEKKKKSCSRSLLRVAAKAGRTSRKASTRCESTRWWDAAGPPPGASTPPLHCIRIFVRMHVFAESCFWNVLSQLMKMKKPSLEIVFCGQVFENSPFRVKNCGIHLYYDSHSGTHTMYQEYWEVTIASVVIQCYRDMGASMCLSLLNPDGEGGGGRGQIVPPPTSSQAVPWL